MSRRDELSDPILVALLSQKPRPVTAPVTYTFSAYGPRLSVMGAGLYERGPDIEGPRAGGIAGACCAIAAPAEKTKAEATPPIRIEPDFPVLVEGSAEIAAILVFGIEISPSDMRVGSVLMWPNLNEQNPCQANAPRSLIATRWFFW